MARRQSITARADQLVRQIAATRAMLPYASVAGLGSLSDEVLVAIFGLTMRIRNELPDVERFSVQTRAEQRAYWRRKQREHRARKHQINQ